MIVITVYILTCTHRFTYMLLSLSWTGQRAVMLSIVHHSQPETLWADRLLYCLSLLVFLLLIQLLGHIPK